MRYLFVTGKLAEPALRAVLADLAPKVGFEYEVAVLNITVAALLTPAWIARHLTIADDVDKVILPGLCAGDLTPLREQTRAIVERGPDDLRDLPHYFGLKRQEDYGRFDIEILAEINFAPRLSRQELLTQARHFRDQGADVIDLGCDPGARWLGVGDAVRALRQEGYRVSIDSMDAVEIGDAVRAGAELVLSVNSCNLEAARDWGVEVVVIPDSPSDLDSLERTAERLESWGVPFRLDPILEPIGFGFAASLGRYLETRRRHPRAEMFMGVGNLTELTDCDSAGVNVLLAGFCQELGIRSVLTTAVANWAASSVRELDLARRLVHHAVRHRVLPKHLEPNLVLLRDPRLRKFGTEALADLARRITDRNFRIFAEDGKLHVINRAMHLVGEDPFVLFRQMQAREQIDPGHAFYLGYEMAKAVTALTLGKNYVQDQALTWGFLTRPETTHPPETESRGNDRASSQSKE